MNINIKQFWNNNKRIILTMLGIIFVYFLGYFIGGLDSDALFCIKGAGQLKEYGDKRICVYPETIKYYQDDYLIDYNGQLVLNYTEKKTNG